VLNAHGGTFRRECLDDLIVLNEQQLRSLLGEFVACSIEIGHTGAWPWKHRKSGTIGRPALPDRFVRPLEGIHRPAVGLSLRRSHRCGAVL